MLTTDRPTTTAPSRPSPGRMLGVVVAGVAGWVIGFYMGVFVVLSLVGWNEFAGWQFLAATIPGGALGASLGASLAHPDTRRSAPVVFGAGLAAAALTALALQIIDGDYGVAILGGGAVVVGTIVVAAGVTEAR